MLRRTNIVWFIVVIAVLVATWALLGDCGRAKGSNS